MSDANKTIIPNSLNEHWMPFSSNKDFKKNPRIINEVGLHSLKKSFDEIGFAQPININLDNTILSGHARVQQLLKEGVVEVDCYVPDRQLTPKQEEAVIIRMNKNVAGTWNFEMLKTDFDFNDLEEYGFTEDDFKDELDKKIIDCFQIYRFNT